MRLSSKILCGGVCVASLLAVNAVQAQSEPGGTIGKRQPMQVHSHARPSPGPLLPAVDLHPNAEAGINKTYSGKPVDVLTFHYDNWRTGWNPTEKELTPASVAGPSFGKLKVLKVDGVVLAQPLLATKVKMAFDQKLHNVLIIATEHNTVYAFDADNYRPLWYVNLGKPQLTGDIGCADIKPEFGITATPTIVRNADGTATVYVVAATEPVSMEFHAKLHALNLADGTPAAKAVEIAPHATLENGQELVYDGQNQLIRAGVAEADGKIYVSVGSHCDHNAANISGWVLGYNTKLKSIGQFHTVGDHAEYELAALWNSGFAPAINETGDLFAITGNGANNLADGGNNYGQSVIRLKPNLTAVKDSFTPFNWEKLNENDADFGSGGIVLIPPKAGQVAPPLAIALGKNPVLHVLNANDLGGLKPKNVGSSQELPVPGGVWGGPAYYDGPNGGTVFLQPNNEYLRSYNVDLGGHGSLKATGLVGTSQGGYGGSMPVVTSDGKTAGTGVVWLIRRTPDVQLEAYDAEKLGAPIFQAPAGTWNVASNNVFESPMVANGRVYVPSVNQVTVWGLTSPPAQ